MHDRNLFWQQLRQFQPDRTLSHEAPGLTAQLAEVVELAGPEHRVCLAVAGISHAPDTWSDALRAAPARVARPTGTVTFLFTDIEGSTRLWEQQPELMRAAFPRQEAIMREELASHGGYVYKMIGDAFQAAFSSAAAALSAALSAQRRLAAEDWGALGTLRVRMAIDSGVVEERADDYVGPLLNRLGRLIAAAHGGQILLSSAAAELARADLARGVTLLPLGTYWLKDLRQPQAITQAVTADLPATFPPLRGAVPIGGAPPFRRTLPVPPTPFIGRAEELARLTALLIEPEVRLLTLVAPGGMGKTRVALEALGRLQTSDLFPDGVAFAELASVVTAAQLETTVASALGLVPATRCGATHPPCQLVLTYLRDKRLLLALDDCEHLLDDVAELVRVILAEAPGVTILATTRERLRLRAERLLPLDGMVAEEDGAALFAATARAIQPTFALDAVTRPQVATICTRLGGMPLAIELAAGWADTLSLAEITAELGQNDALLTTRLRDVPERQRSICTVRDAAWEHLSPEERTVIAHVATCPSGGTQQMNQAANRITLPRLLSLVDKALLRYDPWSKRYVVHELLRQYAVEQPVKDTAPGYGAQERYTTFPLLKADGRAATARGAGQRTRKSLAAGVSGKNARVARPPIISHGASA